MPASWARAIRTTCWPIPAKASSRKPKSPAPRRVRSRCTANIRHGFVYERVPHITLKSIANNAEIDVIWEKWQAKLEPLREKLNAALKKTWQEWEIPREADAKWPEAAKKLHADWWQARIARQKEIDASIAAKAEFEYLYDKPYEDKKKVRVAGPFTVESLSPHRVLGVDENDELIDALAENQRRLRRRQDFAQMILENLKTAGVQQAHKEDRITFTALTPWPGDLVCAEGRYLEGGEAPAPRSAPPSSSARSSAPCHAPDLVAAAREAGDAGFDVLIACAFNYEAHATEFNKLGRIPVLKARMNADLHMADDLKNTGKGNLFVIFGEPDIDILIAERRPDPGEGQRRRRLPPQHRRGPQRRRRGHRLLVHRHRLQRRELLRPPRLLPRRERPLQGAEDHAQGRDQRGSLGHPAQRHLAPLRQAQVRAHRRQGDQPPRRRGDEGVQSSVTC